MLVALTAQPSAEDPEQVLRSAIGRALQGNAAEALALLEQIPPSEFSERDRIIRDCMIERFRSNPQEGQQSGLGVFTDRALRLYRSYWRASLLRPDERAAQEERLIAGLRTLLDLPANAESDRVEAELSERVEAEGHHVLMGRTPPLLEFIVWSSESSDLRRVPLPEGQHSINVKLLDDFASLGWSAYATCERSFTGGWVKPDAIYAVRPGWKDLTAENFQVSFLAHETQHFADKERFGELESWELEYRAKLAELALAKETLPKLLEAFESNRGQDPNVPHSYANAFVIDRLRKELGLSASSALTSADTTAINKAAQALLAEDSAKRR